MGHHADILILDSVIKKEAIVLYAVYKHGYDIR